MAMSRPIVQTRCHTPLGVLHLAASEQGLAGVWFEDQRHLPAQISGPNAWPHAPGHALLEQAAAQLQAYFEGQSVTFDLPLDLGAGTAFQQAVWQALRDIGRGQVLSYGELGRRIGRPSAVRAVGAAVGRNPLSIVVPCHRVLGQGGQLTGYAGGLERKRALLHIEGHAA